VLTTVKCAVVRLCALMAQQSARLITNRPILVSEHLLQLPPLSPSQIRENTRLAKKVVAAHSRSVYDSSSMSPPVVLPSAAAAAARMRGAIHQLLSIILKLRILVLLPVSTMSYVVIAKNYS
jgi:hypothetical protein